MSKPQPLTEDQLNTQLDIMSDDATGNNSRLMRENEYLLERYLLDPRGDEIEEQSKVQANDVADTVDAYQVSLMRIFYGPNEFICFKPTKQSDPIDVQEAEQKTKYIDWQIRRQPFSFNMIHGFIQDALVQKLSAVKYFNEETTEVEEHKKTGVSDEELALFQQSLEGKDVKSIEIVREEEGENGGENAVVFKVERTKKITKIVGIEPENFRLSKNSDDKDEADLIGDVHLIKRGELRAMGFSVEEISQLPLAGNSETQQTSSDQTRMADIRDRDEGGDDTDDQTTISWASEEVEMEDFYARVDFDGDGILERRRIYRNASTRQILVNEVFNHAPYAYMSSTLLAHKIIGRSVAEKVDPVATAKTAILRGMHDNIYAVNNPRLGANENVVMDDLLTIRPNGVVRTEGDSPPAQNLFPIEIPYIGDKALQVIQYWDNQRVATSGGLLVSQGLESDNFKEETATRFEGVKEAGDGKVALVAQVMAETGFRQLYEGIAWINSNFQNTEIEVEILGEELTINPGDWQFNHATSVNYEICAGDDEKQQQTAAAILAVQQQLQAQGSPMVDNDKIYNTLESLLKSQGIENVSRSFNNPARPEQTVVAENEQLRAQNQQLQTVVQQLQERNPLAEAELIRAQTAQQVAQTRGEVDLIKAQGQQQKDIAQLLEDQRQFNIETAQKQEQNNKDLALKLTELESKVNQQLDADYQQNRETTRS